MLAEIYANRQIYPYCPTWALAWNYRRNNILRELVSYEGAYRMPPIDLFLLYRYSDLCVFLYNEIVCLRCCVLDQPT